MPVQFYSLPWHMFQAERAQTVQNIFNQQAQAQSQVAGVQSQNQAAAAEGAQTQQTKQTEGATIDSDTRGAHSFTTTDDQKPPPKKEEPPERIPDPEGRGSILDVQG